MAKRINTANIRGILLANQGFPTYWAHFWCYINKTRLLHTAIQLWNNLSAFKYPPEEKIVVMDEILVDVGRTGKLTFTGSFHDRETGKPARLCGTSVSRATLHNQDYITSMSIGVGGE